MSPVWKRNPPCEAHQKLEKMFLDGQIKPSDNPKAVRLGNTLFSSYSLPVFKGVWKELSAKYGVARE